MENYTPERLETACEFDAYTLINGNNIPCKVEVMSHKDGVRLMIALKSITINNVIDIEAFSINTTNIK